LSQRAQAARNSAQRESWRMNDLDWSIVSALRTG
jgi:hypothetical protein